MKRVNKNHTYKLSTENFGTIFVSLIYDENDRISEIVIHSKKSGTAGDYMLQSIATLINLLLKNNVPFNEIISALYNDNEIFKNYFPNVLHNLIKQ